MSQPTPFNRVYDFVDFQSASPTAPLPANQVEAELNAIETTLDETLTNLALIQRDDGALGNSVVHLDALSTAVKNLALLSATNITGEFAASTAYAVGDIAVDDGTPYLCFVAHTSSATIDLTKFSAITAPLEVPGNPADDDKFLRATGGGGVWVDLTTAMITDIASDIQAVLTADTLALARTALGLTSVGDDLATAASAAAARTTLGATTIGSTIFTAANAAAVITALAVPTLAAANEFTADQEISSASAAATEGPLLTLDRVSASPADSDLLGAILFNGVSDLPTARTMAKILTQVLDVSDTTEDAILAFQTIVAGTLATRGYFGGGLVVGAPTGGDKGAGIINAEDVQIDGTSLAGAAAATWEEIAEGTFNDDSALDVTFTAADYRVLRLILTDLTLTNSTGLSARTDSASGASFDAGASDYRYITVSDSSADVNDDTANAGTTSILLTRVVQGADNSTAFLDLQLFAPNSSLRKLIMAHSVIMSNAATLKFGRTGAERQSVGVINAIRIFPGAGAFDGSYKLLGLKE